MLLTHISKNQIQVTHITVYYTNHVEIQRDIKQQQTAR